MRIVPLLLLILAAYCAVLNVDIIHSAVGRLSVPELNLGMVMKRAEPVTILFGGDVLLGRRIETMLAKDVQYKPFEGIRALFQTHDYVVLNLEGSIPYVHAHTPDLGMRFSMPTSSISYLNEAGVDIVSLANNHAYDYGEAGYVHTRERLWESNIVPVGHPKNERTFATYVTQTDIAKIGILMLHATDGYEDIDIPQLMVPLNKSSDVQVAFIHWGDEYVRVHNKRQQALAHALVDQGIDAVIGHHPHVMQDIEQYGGVPIFYSLGNLVFDQYFSDDVQEGYMLSLSIDKRSITYTLHPYESRTHRSSPRLIEGDARTEVLHELLTKNYFTEEEIGLGIFNRIRS